MPTVKVTDQHLAKLRQIARAMGKGATEVHAFGAALDAAHAKHCGASEEPDESDADEPDNAEPDSKGGESEDEAPASKGEPAERWEDDGEWPKDKWGSPMVDPNKALAALESNIEKSSDDLPPERRGGKPNPLSTIKRWATGEGARRATQPRAQRRG